MRTNLYLIEPGFEAATINIGDSSTTVGIQLRPLPPWSGLKASGVRRGSC